MRDELDVRSMLDGDAIDAFERSAERFDGIADRLHAPLLAPLRVLPVVGRQLSAVTHQAGAAASGLRTAASVSDDLDALVDSSMRSGPERVTALRDVEAVVRRAREAFADLDLGPGEALIGQVASARTRIEDAQSEAVDVLDRAAAVSAGLATFFEGPTDYLLLAANNAQMQNGQGMFLSAGVLHVEDGRMDLEEMGPTADLRSAVPVPLDDDLAARWGWLDPNGDFRHLGLSHRFPVAARTAAELWVSAGQPPVDGVIAVDPFVLRAIMQATGPVATRSGELAAESIVQFALHDQYRGYLDVSGEDTSFSEQRRDQLEEIAVNALDGFDEIASVEPEFVESLGAAARGRHLLAWSRDPRVQAAWEAGGVDGQITPESALLAVINRSGNKLDWFIRTSADLSIEPDAQGFECVVRIAVRNEAPAEGEPAYVVGPYPGSGLEPGEYLGLVTLNLPEGAQEIHFDQAGPLAVAGGDGANRTVATWVRIPRGTTTELVARFRLPAGMTKLRIEAGGRWSPTEWSDGEVRWNDAEAHTLDLPAPR